MYLVSARAGARAEAEQSLQTRSGLKLQYWGSAASAAAASRHSMFVGPGARRIYWQPNIKPKAAMSSVFREIAADEARTLIPMFKNTLTFTVTYQAVNALVEDNGRATHVLALAVCLLVFVLMWVQRLASASAEPAAKLAVGLIETTNSVAVQFVSNLVAVSLRSLFAAQSLWWIIVFAYFSLALLATVASRHAAL